jgi:hypothetical protein
MSQYVEFFDTNYSGQTAQVTFTSLDGSVYDLGERVVPFTFYGDEIEPGYSVDGTYTFYYIRFYKTCIINVLPLTTTTTTFIPVTTTTTFEPTTTTTTEPTTTTTTEPTTTTTTEPPIFNYFTVAKSCEVCDPQLCENFLNISSGGYYFNIVSYQEITPPILLTIDGCCMYIDSVLNQNLPGYSTFLITENQYQTVTGTISEECPKCL